MGEVEGSGMEGWGIGVVSIGVSDLRGLRFSIDFSNVSSFCSTVEEDSFFVRESISFSMRWIPSLAALTLSLMIKEFFITISKSIDLVFEMDAMD